MTESQPHAGQHENRFLHDRDDGSDFDYNEYSQGGFETEDITQEGKIPQIAAKFAVPSILGRPLRGEINDVIKYMIGQKMEHG